MWTAWNLHHRPWTRKMLANDQAVKWAKAKVCAYADSVLCVGQVKDISGATERWKGQVEDLKKQFVVPRRSGTRRRTDWNRVANMSMFNGIEWNKNDATCISNAEEVRNYAMKFLQGHCTFLGPDRKKSGMAIPTIKKDSGVAPPTKWYTNSKRLVILSSKAPVLWRWFLIQNSCSTQFTLWITSELRIGVINSPWQNKKKTSRYYCGHQNFDHSGTRRSGIAGISSDPGTWKQDAGGWKRRFSLHNFVKKFFQHLVFAVKTHKFDRMQTTDGREITPLCRDYSSSWTYRTTRALSANPEGTIIGPVLELHVIKNSFLTDMAKKLQFNHLQTQNTQLTLLFPEKKSVFWMKFMITDKSSGPAMN